MMNTVGDDVFIFASKALMDAAQDLICLCCYSLTHVSIAVHQDPQDCHRKVAPSHTDPSCTGLFGYVTPGAGPCTCLC